jgi:hypothetical protein
MAWVLGVVALVRERDVRVVPALPVPRLVARNQQDRPPDRVEREQNADLRGSGRSWSQFFHVVMTRCLDSVDHWSAELRSLRSKRIDRTLDEISAGRFVDRQVDEP